MHLCLSSCICFVQQRPGFLDRGLARQGSFSSENSGGGVPGLSVDLTVPTPPAFNSTHNGSNSGAVHNRLHSSFDSSATYSADTNYRRQSSYVIGGSNGSSDDTALNNFGVMFAPLVFGGGGGGVTSNGGSNTGCSPSGGIVEGPTSFRNSNGIGPTVGQIIRAASLPPPSPPSRTTPATVGMSYHCLPGSDSRSHSHSHPHSHSGQLGRASMATVPGVGSCDVVSGPTSFKSETPTGGAGASVGAGFFLGNDDVVGGAGIVPHGAGTGGNSGISLGGGSSGSRSRSGSGRGGSCGALRVLGGFVDGGRAGGVARPGGNGGRGVGAAEATAAVASEGAGFNARMQHLWSSFSGGPNAGGSVMQDVQVRGWGGRSDEWAGRSPRRRLPLMSLFHVARFFFFFFLFCIFGLYTSCFFPFSRFRSPLSY